MNDDSQEPWVRRRGDDSDLRSWLESRRTYLTAGAGLVLIAFIGAIWYAYSSGRDAANVGEPPLVRAPEGVLRQKPADPGGMNVPDQDKLVYNRVRGEEGTETVQLRSGPELPMEKPASAVAESAPAVEAELAPVPAPAAAPAAPAQAPAAPAPATTSAPAKQTVAVGGFLIQLGAFGSADGADQAWRMLKQKFPDVLVALSPDVETLERNGKTLYRLRAGVYADKTAADAACTKLKAAGQACFSSSR